MSQEISDLVKLIWAGMLESEVELVSGANRPSIEGICIGCQVSISGEWNGDVVLFGSEDAMRLAASIMFWIELADVSPEDTHDVARELANQVAGNLKTRLPPPSRLGLPIVTEGKDLRLEASDRSVVTALEFSWRDQPVVVEILASKTDNKANR